MESSECIPVHGKSGGRSKRLQELIQKFNYILCFLGVNGESQDPGGMAATWEKRATVQNALEKQENALK